MRGDPWWADGWEADPWAQAAIDFHNRPEREIPYAEYVALLTRHIDVVHEGRRASAATRARRAGMGPRPLPPCLAEPTGATALLTYGPDSLIMPTCLTCDQKYYWPSKFCRLCKRDFDRLRTQLTAEESETFDEDCRDASFVVARVLHFQEEQEAEAAQREEAELEANTRRYQRTADRPYNPTDRVTFWTDPDQPHPGGAGSAGETAPAAREEENGFRPQFGQPLPPATRGTEERPSSSTGERTPAALAEGSGLRPKFGQPRPQGGVRPKLGQPLPPAAWLGDPPLATRGAAEQQPNRPRPSSANRKHTICRPPRAPSHQ
jgi:hypothetical protein